MSLLFLALIAAIGSPAGAQDLSTGALNVTVTDPSGAGVNDARIVVKNLNTNDIHNASTHGKGAAVIPYLNPAPYSVTVTREGFAQSLFPHVIIQTNQVTDIKVSMTVGAASQTVEVSAENSPVLDTTSNTLSTTLNLHEVEDLPLSGRNAASLEFLGPGAVDDNINNLPGGAVGSTTNGFSTMINRNKSGGFDSENSVITNRLEDVQEMTIQSGELDAAKGGTAAMDVGFVTRSGTNHFHGRLFEDYRSDALNANSWYNKASGQQRGLLIINDFGASVGGPLLRNKLFFFASLSNFREPITNTVTTTIPTAATIAGNYSFVTGSGSSAVTHTVNVLQAAQSYGCSTCTGTVNPVTAADLANIESTYTLPGVTQTSLDLNHNSLTFPQHGKYIYKYPTLRLDYNLTPNFRLTAVANESNNYSITTGNPPYPGPLYAIQAASSLTRNYQIVTGFDWNLKSNLINAFRVGYLYNAHIYDSQGVNAPSAAMVQAGDQEWGFSLNSGVNGFNYLRGGSLYPVLSVKDDTTWIHGAHTIEFGVESATENDHYYNNQFVPYLVETGIATGDPVATPLIAAVGSANTSAVTDVEGLYATLTARLTQYSLGQFVNAKTKQFQPGISFDLDERLNQTALFFEDSWRALPTLTLNLGLRWDFTGHSVDETGFYTHPDVPDLWGPTAVGALFQPGVLGGVQNPQEGPSPTAYASTYVHPEPNIGIAWNPRQPADTVLGRLLGQGKSVIRLSYTLKNYTEGAQNFWNFGSNNGANFNTYFQANPVSPAAGFTPGVGQFIAGSLSLGQPLPPLASTSPIPYQQTITEASQAFSTTSYLDFDPHIKQPYVESWSVGIQRSITPNNVIEVRYVGNVGKQEWLPKNWNEVNIFENGFLTNFQNAQANLAASGGKTLQGAAPTPILDQAFKAAGAGAYTNGTFIGYVQQGQAGLMAYALAGRSGNGTYLCSLVGANFPVCAAHGYTGTGAYPINFFQENPYAAGASTLEMTNAGYSNYNALQIDFRQSPNHGMNFDANYTLSKSLGTSVQGSTAPGYYGGRSNSAPGFYTLRNLRLNYFPSAFDVRNVLHVSGTYDLPFGHRRTFFNQSGIANVVIGGWTIGTILTYESGEPHLFTGGTDTVNQNGSGIALIGVTPSQLQKQIGIYPVPGHPRVSLFNPKYIGSDFRANPAYIAPWETAGTYGAFMWLHDPKWISTDMALSKTVPVYKEMSLNLQAEFINVFNHPAFTGMDSGVQDTTFGTTSTTNSPRNIELRGNFQF